MQTTQPSGPTVFDLTFEDVVSFLQARRIKTNCPSCDHGTRQIMIPAQEGVVAMRVQTSEAFVIGGPTIPAVVVSCPNCGFIRQFSALLMLEWKKEAPRGQPE